MSNTISIRSILHPLGLLIAIGIATVATATVHLVPTDHWYYVKRQGSFFILGIMIAIAIYQFVPTRLFEKNRSVWLHTYLASLLLLLLPLLPGIGVEHFGASRWIIVGFGYEFQPSELAKLLLIISMAGFLHHEQKKKNLAPPSFIHELKEFWKSAFWMVLPVLFFILQRDLGSVVSVVLIWFSLQFCYRFTLPVVALSIPILALSFYALVVMEPYRIKRIDGFNAPFTYDKEQVFRESVDAGYQITQSKIAIVEGGIFGVGIGQGVQKLNHLPKAHNDFVFSSVVEETGILGAFTIIILFGVLVLRLLHDAPKLSVSASVFSASIHTAVALWIFSLFMLHVGSCIGLIPTKGITLPFLSYGGSNLVCMLASFGFLARLRRDAMHFERRIG